MVAPIYVDSVVSQKTRLAVEAGYGVLPPVPSWLVLSDTKVVPKSQFETEKVYGAGDELPTGVIVNDEYTNGEVSGKAGYTGIMYPLGSMFGFPADTLVGGSTYDHIWTWDGKTPIIPVSYGMHYGLPGRAKEILGFIFNGLAMTAARGGTDYSSSGFGKAITTGVAMGGVTAEVHTLTVTGAPTAFAPTLGFKGRTASLASAASFTAATIQTLLESIPSIGVGNVVVTGGPLPTTPIVVTYIGKLGGQNVPLLTTTGTTFTGGSTPAFAAAETTPGADNGVVLPNNPIAPLHYDVFIGDSWAEIQAESTKLLAVYSAKMTWGDKWQRSMPVNSTKSSDSIFVGESQDHNVSLVMGADAVAEGLYTPMRGSVKKYVRLHATGGPTGDSTYKYEFVADLALLLTSTEGYGSENGIHVLTWNGAISRDEVLNNAVQFRVRNKRSGL